MAPRVRRHHDGRHVPGPHRVCAPLPLGASGGNYSFVWASVCAYVCGVGLLGRRPQQGTMALQSARKLLPLDTHQPIRRASPAPQVTSEAYSSPSIVLISGWGPHRYVLDDFRCGPDGRGAGSWRLRVAARRGTRLRVALGVLALARWRPRPRERATLPLRPPGRPTTGCATTPSPTPRS